ncbi:MAG: flavin reductase family protein [Nitrososphaera sp.]|nr:flavin reductase family protein [Nitrososphaera sp.]
MIVADSGPIITFEEGCTMNFIDPSQIDSVFRLIDKPIWIITAATPSVRGGLVASWVLQVSIDPESPRVLAGIAPNHYTHQLIQESRALAAHLITAQQIAYAWRFAIGSGRDRDKLAGIRTSTARTGSPILTDCLAWLDCQVITQYDEGDRTFFLANVVAGQKLANTPPLTEGQLLAAASPEQKAKLQADLLADIQLQRPLLAEWQTRLENSGQCT